jgi:hypothetical protein
LTRRKHEQDIFDMAGSGFESTLRVLLKVRPRCGTFLFKNRTSSKNTE